MKIAVTSNNGEYIDTHFGKAERILIYKVSEKETKLLEVKNIASYCSSEGHGFNAEKFEAIYNQIQDCSKLYTQKIGPNLAERFLEKGIVTKISDCEINKILKII